MGEFPAQKVSNAGNVSILWRHHMIWQVNLHEKHFLYLKNETYRKTKMNLDTKSLLTED